MTPESDFLPPRGEPQAWELLVVSRAHEFAVFLQTMGTESFANFKEARKDKQNRFRIDRVHGDGGETTATRPSHFERGAIGSGVSSGY